MASTRKSLMRMIGIAIPTSMAVLAMGSGSATAATCDTSYVDASCGSTCQSLYGSDTMTQVIKDSIKGSKACITYVNTGSGQGEKNITGSGQNYNQGLAPMSRNFTQSILTGAAAAYNPTPDNVLCLDAAVNAVGNINGHIQNLPCSATSGNNVCDPTCDINVNSLAIALGGYPASCRGSGTWSNSGATTPECADPQRVAAIAKLTALQGARIDHFYRRDDKSGTQDTFRERLQFNRWCNGKSEGNVNAQWSNLKNYDLDPVRRTCTNEHSDTTHARTHCTYYPLNIPMANGTGEADTCFNGDVLLSTDSRNPYGVNIPCTQGWVVALSETDTGHTDITVSIGQRIGTDFNGQTMGGAGRQLRGLQRPWWSLRHVAPALPAKESRRTLERLHHCRPGHRGAEAVELGVQAGQPLLDLQQRWLLSADRWLRADLRRPEQPDLPHRRSWLGHAQDEHRRRDRGQGS